MLDIHIHKPCQFECIQLEIAIEDGNQNNLWGQFEVGQLQVTELRQIEITVTPNTKQLKDLLIDGNSFRIRGIIQDKTSQKVYKWEASGCTRNKMPLIDGVFHLTMLVRDRLTVYESNWEGELSQQKIYVENWNLPHRMCQFNCVHCQWSIETKQTTTSISISAMQKFTLQEIETLKKAAITVLSFSQRAPVYCVRTELFYAGNDQPVQIEIITANLNQGLSRSNMLIASSNENGTIDLENFLQLAINAYIKKNSQYDFDRLKYYYCKSFNEPFLESKFLYTSVFMETLCFGFMKNVKRLAPKYHPQTGSLQGFVKCKNRKGKDVFYKFEEKLDMLAKELHLKQDFNVLISNRNAIIHSGCTKFVDKGDQEWVEASKELYPIYRLIDKFLLCIFEYKGMFCPYDNPGIFNTESFDYTNPNAT